MQSAITNVSDSLNAAKDTLSGAVNPDNVFNKISFDPQNIIDGDGILISVVGYVIVFAALLILFIFFANLTKLLHFNIRKKLRGKGHNGDLENEDLAIPGEITAAISMALQIHFAEVHDLENTVLTIKRIPRPYSPWSSKIYGLREYPRKK